MIMVTQVSKAMFTVGFIKLFSSDDWKTNFDLFLSTENCKYLQPR